MGSFRRARVCRGLVTEPRQMRPNFCCTRRNSVEVQDSSAWAAPHGGAAEASRETEQKRTAKLPCKAQKNQDDEEVYYALCIPEAHQYIRTSAPPSKPYSCQLHIAPHGRDHPWAPDQHQCIGNAGKFLHCKFQESRICSSSGTYAPLHQRSSITACSSHDVCVHER